MIHNRIANIKAFSIFVLVIIACGTPTEVSNPITVSKPGEETIWSHYQNNIEFQWEGGNEGTVLIELLKQDVPIDTICVSTSNNGHYTYSNYVSPSWGCGIDYQIRVSDGSGERGTSESFCIYGTESVVVLEPTSFSFWSHGEAGQTIQWENSIGTEIQIELWEGDSWIDDICNGVSNTGSFSLTTPVAFQWGSGTTFRLRVIDDEYCYGFSEYFTIAGISNDNLLAYYPFNGNANDESGNGRNGTVSGADLCEDRFNDLNSAYNFNGVQDYIKTSVFGWKPLSVSVWINKSSQYSSSAGIVSARGNSWDRGIHWDKSDNEIIIYYNKPTGGSTEFSDVYIANNIWCHIVVIWENKRITIYKDGVSVFSENYTYSVGTGGDNKWYIGNSGYTDPGYMAYRGMLDDIRIYNRVLQPIEIQALYHEGGWE